MGEEPKKPVKLDCTQTLMNNKDFKKENRLFVGALREVICTSGCIDEDVPLFGNNPFSEDSSICKAGFYAGMVNEDGGNVRIKVIKGLES